MTHRQCLLEEGVDRLIDDGDHQCRLKIWMEMCGQCGQFSLCLWREVSKRRRRPVVNALDVPSDDVDDWRLALLLQMSRRYHQAGEDDPRPVLASRREVSMTTLGGHSRCTELAGLVRETNCREPRSNLTAHTL